MRISDWSSDVCSSDLIDAGRRDQGLDARLDDAGRGWRRGDGNRFGQSVALIGVEYREALEERDGARRLAGFRRAPAFVVRREAVGIDAGGAALPLSAIAAQPERLAARPHAPAGEATPQEGPPND